MFPPDLQAVLLPHPIGECLPLAQFFDLLAAIPFGGYISWWKVLIFLVIFLAWIRLLLWIDKDTVAARMPREAINAGQWVLLAAAHVLVLMLPIFLVALAVYVALFAVGIGGYLIWRQQVVGLADLPAEFNFWVKNLFRSKKVKRSEHREEQVGEGMLTLIDSRGAVPQPPEQDDPQRSAYEAAHRLLMEPLYHGAERITLANVGQRYASKYRVDGFDHPGTGLENDVATGVINTIKQMAGLDPSERRKLQKGKMRARTARGTHDLDVLVSGTRSGETVVFEVDHATRYRDRATALGMTAPQREALADSVKDNSGLVLAAAPPGGGLTALLYGLVQEHDAFIQHIITIERPIEREMEGVTQNTLPSGIDATEEGRQFSWIADQMPDVLMADRADSTEAAKQVIRLAGEERRRVYLGMRASDAAEAIAKWRQLVGDDREAFRRLSMVIAGRSLRKLCDACKIPYEPGEAALAKMGVPKGKVRTLFKGRTTPMLDSRGNPVPCEFCGQLGYKGRIGVFEVVPLSEEARRSLRADHSPQAVRGILRDTKLPTLNEAALRAVLAGNTDLQEVQRVLGGAAAPGRKHPAPARKAG